MFYPYLKADFTVSPVEICAPYTVTITNNSQGGAGIKTVFWDFGDGSTSSDASKIITHTYTNTTDTIQTRTLRLVIGSGNGCFDTLTRTIKVYPDVFSSFTMDKNSGCHPLSVNFTPPSNNIPVSWLWDFGDGGSSSLANPSHVFLNNSPRGFDTVYNVRLVCEFTAFLY
jgi:PKD repeat protein